MQLPFDATATYNEVMNIPRFSSAQTRWRKLATTGFCVCAISMGQLTSAAGKTETILVERTAATVPARSLALARAHYENVARALATPTAILTLGGALSPDQREAQQIALGDARFLEGTREVGTGKAFRNEVFGIYPLRESDMSTPELRRCLTQTRCYRVEQYQFAWNDTRFAVVDVLAKRVLAINKLPDTQPDIPTRLERVAAELAANSPLVRQALGRAPTVDELVMATTKTALNRTRCERSRHLCVAPTIVEGNSALFVIVDLTAYRVVGARWTKLGRAQAAPSERRLQNEGMARDYCDRAVPVDREGWKFDFQITSSDGVKISNVSYKDQAFLRSVKTVDWHVGYSWKEGFGYSDAVGCPVFSQAAVVAVDPPRFVPLEQDGKTVGFSLYQDFRGDQWPRPCNYYYRQRFDFYADGRFRPVNASFGRGCGDDGMYRPVTRVAFADITSVSERSGQQWRAWPREDWRLAERMNAANDGALLRFGGATAQYDLIPNKGQWDASRGDNAFLYVSVQPEGRDEGESDLPAIGNCCAKDYRQGPEKFIEPKPEPIGNAPLVLWYVAQMKNDSRVGQEYCWADYVLEAGIYAERAYPCYSGPMLRKVEEAH